MPRTKLATFEIEELRILDEEGRVDRELDPQLEPETLRSMYRFMLYARLADERMLKLQRQGRLGTFPLGTGQEAAQVGPAFAMAERDWLVGSFRELGARLVRGEPLDNSLLYYRGFEEGNVHPAGREARITPIAVIVASQLPHAVGIGYAMRYFEEPAAVLAYVGDGGTSEGDFHEALNMASLWRVPVVFVIQNNHWAISVPRSRQTASRTLAQKAVAYEMPGIVVDGNDVLATYAAAREALERARRGGGPTLIEAVTYRLMQHTTADDPKRYRSDDEVESWWRREPLRRFARYLEERGILDEEGREAMAQEISEEIDAAVERVEAFSGRPDAPFDHVFAEPHPYLEKQRRLFLEELRAE